MFFDPAANEPRVTPGNRVFRSRIAVVVGSNPFVSTRNTLMDVGFSEEPPPLGIAAYARLYPRRRTETLFDERISGLSVLAFPRRDDPMIEITQALKDTKKDRHRLIRATVAHSIMTPR